VLKEELVFEVVCDAVTSKAPAGCWDECTELDEANTPNLSHFVEEKKHILTQLLTAISGEPASILGNGDNTVSFIMGMIEKTWGVIISVCNHRSYIWNKSEERNGLKRC
jgi:hypothetical protein